jgi:hypothetical protein
LEPPFQFAKKEVDTDVDCIGITDTRFSSPECVVRVPPAVAEEWRMLKLMGGVLEARVVDSVLSTVRELIEQLIASRRRASYERIGSEGQDKRETR